MQRTICEGMWSIRINSTMWTTCAGAVGGILGISLNCSSNTWRRSGWNGGRSSSIADRGEHWKQRPTCLGLGLAGYNYCASIWKLFHSVSSVRPDQDAYLLFHGPQWVARMLYSFLPILTALLTHQSKRRVRGLSVVLLLVGGPEALPVMMTWWRDEMVFSGQL